MKPITCKIIMPIALAILFLTTAALGEESNNVSSTKIAGFGFHGGLNFSSFSYSNTILNRAKEDNTGYLMGLHFENLGTSMLRFRIEGNYSSKGYTILNFATVTHRYLQIPLLIKITPIPGPIEFFAEAGPAASLHLSSTTEIANNSITFNDDSDNWDISLIAGLGIGFKLKDIKLEFDARYDYGLNNLNDSSNITVNSRAIQLLAGVTFLM